MKIKQRDIKPLYNYIIVIVYFALTIFSRLIILI